MDPQKEIGRAGDLNQPLSGLKFCAPPTAQPCRGGFFGEFSGYLRSFFSQGKILGAQAKYTESFFFTDFPPELTKVHVYIPLYIYYMYIY